MSKQPPLVRNINRALQTRLLSQRSASHLSHNRTSSPTTIPTKPPSTIQQFHTHPSKMADDTSYSAFLSKANEDPNSGARPDTYNESTSQARSRYDPTDSSNSSIPSPLQNLPNTPYVSDTDADWEPVFFSYASHLPPTLEQFKQCLRAKSGFGVAGASGQGVEELSLREFDPEGLYAEIVERVAEAGREEGKDGKEVEGGGEVKVFRLEVDRTRVEYYVLTVGERKLLGVVAKAVES